MCVAAFVLSLINCMSHYNN